MKTWLGLICCVMLTGVLDIRPAQAVPAFARREGVSCQMCHFRMPELNEDGYAYLRRGLREEPDGMMGEMGEIETGQAPKTPVAAEPRQLGQPLDLQWADYLTVMGHHMLIAEKGARATFDAGVIDVWAAGPFDRRWSALANPSFDIENGGSSVDQAYGQYISHWNARFLSGRAGQMLPFAMLFNQGGPSMPLSTPLILSTPPDTGTSWTPNTSVRGLETGSINLPRWNIYLGVGQPHLETTLPDDVRHTDIYASGEWLFGASGSSLAIYGYSGKAFLSPAASGQSFHRIGLFGNGYFGKSTKGVVGYMAGSDKDVNDSSLGSSGYFVLGEQLLSDHWAAYARYDWLKQDLSAGGSETTEGPTLGVSWWAVTEIRLTLETQFVKRSGESRDQMLSAEFLWAF